MNFRASRYHDFSYGHTVTGHEGKCRNLHGHNGRVHFNIEADGGLDSVGRVMDFSVIKEKLCEWLEENWDHRFLVWEEDPRMFGLIALDPTTVVVPFNPTAENMAHYLVNYVAPVQLSGTGCRLVSVTFEETAKCSCYYGE